MIRSKRSTSPVKNEGIRRQPAGDLEGLSPERNLLLTKRGVYIEETDERALAYVANIYNLWFTSDVGLGVPEGIALVNCQHTRCVYGIGSRGRLMTSEQEHDGDTVTDRRR